MKAAQETGSVVVTAHAQKKWEVPDSESADSEPDDWWLTAKN